MSLQRTVWTCLSALHDQVNSDVVAYFDLLLVWVSNWVSCQQATSKMRQSLLSSSWRLAGGAG